MVIRPGYVIKTMIKAPLFFFVPVIYSIYDKSFKPFNAVRLNFKGVKLGLALGIGIYLCIMLFYVIANPVISLNSIKLSLENNLGINKTNFFAIAFYVCIVNSFLEEWFFRGFIFTIFNEKSRKIAYIVSSLSFGIYHIAIMDGMFNIFLLFTVLLGLFIGGTIFNYLNEKTSNIFASWFCHMFANFAMNTIGFILFF